MKSTIPLQGDKKAVIEVPYSKIIAAQTNSRGPIQQEQSCCDSRIIIGSVGGKSKQNLELKKMIDQLEVEYQRDMREKDEEIRRLKQEKRQYLSTQKIQVEQIQIVYKAKCEAYQHELKALREERSLRQQQLRKIREEKQLILRNKINEFRQIEYIDRINQQQRIIRLKDIQLQELMSRLHIFKEEKNKLEDQLDCLKAKFGSEVSKLTSHITQTSNKFAHQHQEYSYSYKVREEQSLRLVSNLKQQINFLQMNLKESEYRQDSKNRQLLLALESSKKLDEQLNKKIAQNQNLSLIVSDLKQQRNTLLKTQEQKTILINQIQQERAKLFIAIAQRQEEINRLKIQLSSREKVYEVKIQRVIDGKQQIAQLQSAVFELQQQLKQLSMQKNYLAQDLLRKQKQFDELLALKFKLEGEIVGLKAYISKRQGSFKWVVQRQIQRDMVISQQQPQLYKVSQVRQFSREPENNPNRIIAEQIAVNMQANLFSGFTENLQMGNVMQ